MQPKSIDAMKKKLFFTVATVCTVLVLLTVAFTSWMNQSFAWLTKNTEATAKVLGISFNSSGSLVISDEESQIIRLVAADINNGSPFYVQGAVGILYPSTHDSDYSTYSTGLKVVANPLNIGYETGIIESDEIPLQYATAENGPAGTNQYYIDYPIYLASVGGSLENTTLKISIVSATKTVDGVEEKITAGSLMATSADIYKNSVSSANYLGTLNVAGVDNTQNDFPGTYNPSAKKREIYLLGSNSTTGTVPLNTEGYLTYVLRCYFDGALLQSPTSAYINTSTVDSANVKLNFTISATTED